MSDKISLIKTLTESIIQTCTSLIENGGFDKTYKGRIVTVNGNKCTVRINGVEYNAVSCCTVAVGDVVYATVMQNNYKNIIVRKCGGCT